MRPLFHPSVQDITLEGIFHALSDPVRATIYADIVASDCPHTCADFLNINEQAIPKSTLSQHFKALRDAGLIRSERRGVQMHNSSRCAEIELRFPGLIRAIINAHNVQSMGKPHGGNPAMRKHSDQIGRSKSKSRRPTQ
ncbi:MAG: ArsR/SmtB family transcription factor [Phycisphaerae bacterium]